MTDIEARVMELYGQSATFDDSVRDILMDCYNVEKDKSEANAGYNATGLLAVEVGVAMANLIRVIKRPESGRTFRVVLDFTIALNNNLFWGRHATSLMPLIHVILMDHLDSLALQLERGEVKCGPYDKLVMGAETAPLAIFSIIAFLIGGPTLQMAVSVKLKKSLMPLLAE